MLDGNGNGNGNVSVSMIEGSNELLSADAILEGAAKEPENVAERLAIDGLLSIGSDAEVKAADSEALFDDSAEPIVKISESVLPDMVNFGSWNNLPRGLRQYFSCSRLLKHI